MSSLTRIPGIGIVGTFKIGAIVVHASRFKTKGHFLSYCGFIKHRKMSGGRSYRKRSKRKVPHEIYQKSGRSNLLHEVNPSAAFRALSRSLNIKTYILLLLNANLIYQRQSCRDATGRLNRYSKRRLSLALMDGEALSG